MKKPVTILEMHKSIRKMDRKLRPETTDYRAAVLLLSSAFVGPNEKTLSEFTGYSLKFIRPRARRLRQNGIWKGNKVVCEWFKKNGGIAFWCDAAVAEGWLKRK